MRRSSIQKATNQPPSLVRRTSDFFELGRFGGSGAALFEYFMIGLILANVAAVTLETVPSIWSRFQGVFYWFDMISVLVFTGEYILRVWASAESDSAVGGSAWKNRLRYMGSPLAVIDLLAILPFYIGIFATVDLRALRIFRLLRMLKLVRYSPALESLSRVLYMERRALTAAFIILMGLLFFSATLAHLFERQAQPGAFGTIPAALWWALSTLTTVGYGDVVPITTAGQLLGGVVMVVGFAFYAVPIGIIASGFSDEVHRREFLVPVQVVDGFPIFRHLNSQATSELATRMRTLTIAPGTVITHKMDMHNGLYCILSGEISAFFNHRAVPLKSGDYFGEFGIIMDGSEQPSTVARSHSKVMRLESADFHTLVSMYPELSNAMAQFRNQRLAELVADGILTDSDRAAMLAKHQDQAGFTGS